MENETNEWKTHTNTLKKSLFLAIDFTRYCRDEQLSYTIIFCLAISVSLSLYLFVLLCHIKYCWAYVGQYLLGLWHNVQVNSRTQENRRQYKGQQMREHHTWHIVLEFTACQSNWWEKIPDNELFLVRIVDG